MLCPSNLETLQSPRTNILLGAFYSCTSTLLDDADVCRSLKDNVVPGSDMAGTIAAVGDGIKRWQTGDRVCANFSLDHIDGDITPEIKATGLGAPIDGVLKEYLVVPAHVSRHSFSLVLNLILRYVSSRWSKYPNISASRKHQPFLVPLLPHGTPCMAQNHSRLAIMS
jgi:hypothetical protein